MPRFLCIACAAGLFIAAAASANSHLSQDAQVNDARALINNQRYAAALEILRPLAQDANRADLTDIRFLTGLAAISAAQSLPDGAQKTALLDEAIAVLHAILLRSPQLIRVRLELARAFFLKGEDGLARQHFRRVLVGNPQKEIAVNINNFLGQIRARRKLSGYLSLSIEQNDNINSASDTETIYLFGLPFVLGEQSRPQSETGLLLSTGVEHQARLAPKDRWRFGVDFVRAEYERRALDQTELRVRSGPRRIVSRNSEFSLQAIAVQRYLARDRHSVGRGFQLNAYRQINPRTRINLQSSRIKNDYRDTPTSNNTDTRHHLNTTYLFSPLLQGSIGLGYNQEKLTGGTRNRERVFHFGLSKIIANGWTLGTNLEYAHTRNGVSILNSSERRVDRKQTTRLFLLNRGLTFFGFSPQLAITRERQTSNSQLNNYKRTRVGMRFIQQF